VIGGDGAAARPRVAAITFCFDSLDLREALGRIRAAGYDCVELWYRHAGGEADYTSRSVDDARRLREHARDAGLEPVSYCIGGIEPEDVSSLDRAFAFAAGLGVEVVNGSFEDWAVLPGLEEAATRAQAHGVRFALENHWKARLESPDDVLSALDATGPSIGANLDLGQAVAAGYDPLEAVDRLFDRLYHVQVQDVPGPGELQSTRPGSGGGRLVEVLEHLRARGFEGILSVEHDEDREPAIALAEARRLIDRVWAAPRREIAHEPGAST
jgi:sugar phosphate isomerase/epimerase